MGKPTHHDYEQAITCTTEIDSISDMQDHYTRNIRSPYVIQTKY